MPDGLLDERLLETARDMLLDQLLPALPAHQRHAALMVANAMAIVARGMVRRGGVEDCAPADRQLRELIRQGRADAGAEAATLHARLLADTRARVEVSNPKYLARRPRAVS